MIFCNFAKSFLKVFEFLLPSGGGPGPLRRPTPMCVFPSHQHPDYTHQISLCEGKYISSRFRFLYFSSLVFFMFLRFCNSKMSKIIYFHKGLRSDTGFRGWGSREFWGESSRNQWRNQKSTYYLGEMKNCAFFKFENFQKILKDQWNTNNFEKIFKLPYKNLKGKLLFPFSLPSSRTFVILDTSGKKQNFWGWFGGSSAGLREHFRFGAGWGV